MYVKLLQISYVSLFFKYFQVWSVRIRRKRYIIWCCKNIYLCIEPEQELILLQYVIAFWKRVKILSSGLSIVV